MSETIREQLDRYRIQLADYRRLYEQDDTVTQLEIDQLNSLWARVESLQRGVGASSNAGVINNPQTLFAAPSGGPSGKTSAAPHQDPLKSAPAAKDELDAEVERARLGLSVDKALVKELSQRVLKLLDETLSKPEWKEHIKDEAKSRAQVLPSMDGLGEIDAEKSTATQLASEITEDVMAEVWSRVSSRENARGEIVPSTYKATSNAVLAIVNSQLRKRFRRKVGEVVGLNLDVPEAAPGRIIGEVDLGPILGTMTSRESVEPPKELLKAMLALLDKELSKPAVKQQVIKETAKRTSATITAAKAEEIATLSVWSYIRWSVLHGVIDEVNEESINSAVEENIGDKFARKEFEPKIKELEKTQPDSRIVRLWKEREQIPQDIREQEEKIKVLEKELAGFEEELSRLTKSNAQSPDESTRGKIEQLKQRIAKTKEWLADTRDLVERSLPLKEQKLSGDIWKEKKKYK